MIIQGEEKRKGPRGDASKRAGKIGRRGETERGHRGWKK